MRKSNIFFIACLAFILGIALYSFFFPSFHAVKPFHFYTVALITGVAAVISYVFVKNRRALVILLGGSFFILGLWRYAVTMPIINESQIAYHNGRNLSLRGIVSGEPDIREKNVQYTIGELQLVKDELKNLNGKILLIAKPFPEYKYGDKVEFRCKLEKPESFNDFNYAAYLARDDIYAICRLPDETRLVARDQSSRVMAFLYSLKNRFVFSVNRILPEPQASFLGGILYGAKRSIPEDLKDAFKKTGTAHLVALSGYNISIMASFITATLSWFWIPRRAAFPLATVAIIGFVLLTGAQASVVRAAVMGIIVLLAKNIGRLSKPRNLLTFTAAVMLVQNPKILAWDLGFQLSFAATVGLLFLSPYFSEKFKFLTTWLNIREAAAATFAAIIFTLPLLLYNFGTLSLIAPLANLLIVPLIPLTMGLGFAAALLGLVWLPVGQIAGWFAWVPLSYEIGVIKWLAYFPNFELKISLIPFLLLYSLVFYFICYLWKHKRKSTT